MIKRNILKHVDTPLEQHKDKRGVITDIFYNTSINHVAHIKSKAGTKRGDHYHKQTVQHILVINGVMEYWYQIDESEPVQTVYVYKNEMVTTPPLEIHALKFLTDVDFIVFTQGPRGGKDYENDTYRITPSIIRE